MGTFFKSYSPTLPASFLAPADNRAFALLKQNFEGTGFVGADFGCLLQNTTEVWPGFQQFAF